MTFLTRYFGEACGANLQFSSYIVAPDEYAAGRMATKRGLREAIVGRQNESKLSPAIEPTPAFFHWLTFVTFVAGRAGHSLDSLVGDGGIIHDMAHQLQGITLCGIFRDNEWSRALRRYKDLLRDIGFGEPEREERPTLISENN